jgi:hypothetical protein
MRGGRRRRLALSPRGRACRGRPGEILEHFGRRRAQHRRSDRDRHRRLPAATFRRCQSQCLRRPGLQLPLLPEARTQAPGNLPLALAAPRTVAGAPDEDLLGLGRQGRHTSAECVDELAQVSVPRLRRRILPRWLQLAFARDRTCPLGT